mgnify:FL=1|jgi:hypothetical protein
MAKFYGVIGYAISEETEPGVFEEQIIERNHVGDVIRNTRRLKEVGKVNDDITISNQISILSDPFTSNNFHTMRYVSYMGSKWKVVEVEVQYPRLILTLGGLYNA